MGDDLPAEATFAFRTDAGQIDFRCRRHQGQVALEARGADAALILRLHDVESPWAATADGQALPRLGPEELARADRGWAVDGRTAIVKARAREIRIE